VDWINRHKDGLGLVAEDFMQAFLLPRAGFEALALHQGNRAGGEAGAEMLGKGGLGPASGAAV
jgi:hypothetical protein